jgi:hypothetical protein
MYAIRLLLLQKRYLVNRYAKIEKHNAGGIESDKTKKAALYLSIPCGACTINGVKRDS